MKTNNSSVAANATSSVIQKDVGQQTATVLPLQTTYSGSKARKMKKTFAKPAANAKAVQIAKSWLKAANVPVEKSNVADFSIIAKDGGRIEVVVTNRIDDARPLTRDALVSVLGPEITHPNRTTAFAALHKVTRAGGYGEPVFVDRGVEPEHKVFYHDQPELVTMRHREFRDAPNPQPGELEKYEQVINNVCWFIYRVNKRFCDQIGHEVSDIKSYAYVLTCNYLHKYQIAAENVTDHDNEKLLTNHLKQRLVAWVKTWKLKERNVRGDAETMSIGTTGYTLTGIQVNDIEGKPAQDSSMTDEEYLARHNKLNMKSEATRRKSAKALLDKSLAAMPHDVMVETLDSAVKNFHLCPDSRDEAASRLNAHKANCTSCMAKAAAESAQT